ncbi:3-carboxy-cis,cis-muconate cycloisomerase [Penicillium digitatum PHI26]|uniref:3-carboxy-cis,cis-muconate cycloisomerase n=2 Tax=Penicillium digitatum TaxID=36651 RepID=K9G3R9_PEND2|nr:3-carboxy-cis,cis-muconate cycloisomerase [Penicillium digitatum Pd1]EKV16650.1 3-carboxy-cis,cis-muconate cycloisomerase [Penicillium digitatum PHI26]EKV22042.1 3-carboxy-cis,cis-muconate cycloisomerase [Penicillium digitatum Pd1]
MAVSALASRIFRNLFGTQEIRDIFTDKADVQSLIEVEAALARAEAAVGVIPADAGKALTDAFARLQIDILRNSERIEEIEQRCLLVQFGGAAGIIASLGADDTGLRVREQLAVELGLNNPDITWHVALDNVAEILNFLALAGGTLGKIVLDMMKMSSNEFDEKRNPISSEVILAASKMLRANASLGLDVMVTDYERASGPWHLEWVALPDAVVTAVGVLHRTDCALGGLGVNVDSMKRHLYSTQGLIVGEAVMMGQAPHLGQQGAHDLVYEACKCVIEQNRTLLEILPELPP